MFKTIKKALFFSLFAYSLIFPMRQIVQSALVNTFSKSSITQLALPKMINKSRSFGNSPILKCPGISLVLTYQMVNETVKSETIDVATKQETVQTTSDKQESVVIDSQDTSTNSETSSDLKQINGLNQNIPSCYINLYQNQKLPEWQPSSPEDKNQSRLNYNNTQAAQHISEILDRGQAEYQRKVYVTNIKSEASSFFSNYQAIVQDRAYKFVDSSSSLSHQEIVNKKAALEQKLYPQERALLEFIKQDPNFNDLLGLLRNGSEDGTIRYDILEKLKIEDQHKVLNYLNLNAERDATKLAIQEYNWMLGRPEQESRDFVSQIENASANEIQKKILPDLVAKKDALTSSFIEKSNELACKNDESNGIDFQLELLNNKSWLAKAGDWFYSFCNSNDIKKNLANNKIKVIAEQQKIARELALVDNERAKHESQIAYAQKILHEKKEIDFSKENLFELQEPQLIQENQETSTVYEEIVKNQHDLCNFDTTNCSDSEVANQWADRQEALSKTIEQGYVQYDQEFNLTPETKAFLAIHGIDHKNFKNFHGTALQQQLHGEMCNALSLAAKQQAQFAYQSNLLTNVVDFADAAYDANKNNQVLLASQLLDVDCYLLKLNHQIITSILNDPVAYAQAGVLAIERGLSNVGHMLTHPSEIINGLGKSLYYALETAVLNSVEIVAANPAIYAQMRIERNAEIGKALQNLGEKFEKSSGPERFGALVQFGTEIGASAKVIQAVGKVCGAVQSQAKALRTLEGVASIAEEQGLTQEILQAAENATVTAKENIAKNVTTELVNAEVNVTKSTKTISGAKATQEVETTLQKSLKALEDILKDTMPGEVTTGRTKQYIKNGYYEDAVKDFYSLNPSNVKKIPGKEGLHGTLPDGRNINVRLESTYKTSTPTTEIMKSGNTAPTIEIMNPGGGGTRIKIRYENKL